CARRARLAAYCIQNHDLGKDCLLDAETSAAAWRGDETKAVSGHAQCVGHERLDDERPLKVRPYGVTIGSAFKLRNNTECLHGRGGITRKRIRELEDSNGHSKGGIRVAVTKATPAYDVGSEVLMNERSIAHARVSQVCYCRKDLVLNVDQIAGVLRDIARIRNHHGNRLADISRLLDGDWVVSQRGLDDARNRPD